MPRWLAQLPLIRALKALAARRERGALALYVALCAAGAIAVSTPLSRATQAQLMAVHHMRPTSLPSWLLLQLVPKMYSFANTCRIGDAPLAAGDAGEAQLEDESFFVNHYPTRKARFDAMRGALAAGDHPTRFVTVTSTYRGHRESTSFIVSAEPGRLLFQRQAWP